MYVTFTSQFTAASEWHCVTFLGCVCLLALTPFLDTPQNREKWQLASSCLPVHSYTLTTQLQPDGFTWNFIFEHFFENLPRKIHVPLISDMNNKYLTDRHMYIYDVQMNSS